MSPTPVLKDKAHSMQTKKGQAQVKNYSSDSDSSYRPQSPLYSPDSDLSTISPVSSAHTPSSPLPPYSGDSSRSSSVSLSRYQPPAKRKKAPEPVILQAETSIVSRSCFTDSILTEPTSWPVSLRQESQSRAFDIVEFKSLSAAERDQGLSTGYINNLSVSPSVRRIAEVREHLLRVKELNSSSSTLVHSWRDNSYFRSQHIIKAIDLVDLQLEEKKIQTLGKYRELFAHPWRLTKQVFEHIHCFDRRGKQICFHSLVEVTSPFKKEPELGEVVQVLENNLVLVHLESTNKVTGFFGSEIVLADPHISKSI